MRDVSSGYFYKPQVQQGQRINVGDVVLSGSQRYKVTKVGNKYLHAHAVGSNPNATYLLHIKHVRLEENNAGI